MAVADLIDQSGVEFLSFDEFSSTQYHENWRTCEAMVNRQQRVSFQFPSFYLERFAGDDALLSKYLADEARQHAHDANESLKEVA